MKGDTFFQQVATRRPFSQMHPRLGAFFREYLAHEKVSQFGEQVVLNTHFPPYPSRAFDTLVKNFTRVGDASDRRLHSVTLAVTNRCDYNCWHCYNAGRSQTDVPLAALRDVAGQLQDLGAVMVALSGGEPLLRPDLEEIAAAFDDRACVTLNTTGDGLTPSRADALCASGVFAVGVSLDSTRAEEHDRTRGKEGAYATAIRAIELTQQSGMYPYLVAVATLDFLEPERFWAFMSLASDIGALEVHLLEPSATGRLAGKTEALIGKAGRQQILRYQREVAERDDLPSLSSFAYLESPDAFGCGAGLTHIYIDGSGSVCPCNLVPLSFGNVTEEPLALILERMGACFQTPRCACAGRVLADHIPEGDLPSLPLVSLEVCDRHLRKSHPLPRFYQIRSEAHERVGSDELRAAYDGIGEHYDEFWLSEAGAPVRDLVDRLDFGGSTRVLDAGCGTGYATALVAASVAESAEIVAVDLSEGMLAEARKRMDMVGSTSVRFIAGDALTTIVDEAPFDTIVSTWVLGYIPLPPFFAAAHGALSPAGTLGLVVHKANSPYEALRIFGELVAEDPSVMEKHVAFDFPSDMGHACDEVRAAGLTVEQVWEGQVAFRYDSPRQVLEHLIKSGAGAAFYDAVAADRRDALTGRFLDVLAASNEGMDGYTVVHDYVSCVARR